MANLGAGLGAFMTGLQGGMNFGQQFKQNEQIQKERGIRLGRLEQENSDNEQFRAVSKQAATDAGAARQADIDGKIQVGAAQQGEMTVPTFNVGNKQYANKEEADKAASKDVDSFLDYYTKTSAPKLIEHWASTGEVDKAKAFQTWMEDENVKKGTKAWAGAVRSFQIGDKEGFKNNLLKAYNQQGYFDDGVTATKIDDVKNDQGQLAGYAITFKDADGNERTENFDGDDVANLGLQALAPDKVLSYGLEQLKTAQAARAGMAKEDRAYSRDLGKLQIQNQNSVGLQNNQAALTAAAKAEERRSGSSPKVVQANAIAMALKSMGKDDAYIQKIYPQLLGIERGSKSTTDRIDGTIAVLAKSDINFAELPPTEQVARATAMIEEVDKATASVQENTQGATAAGQTRHNAGPDSNQAPPKSRGIPMRDSKTGEIIYR